MGDGRFPASAKRIAERLQLAISPIGMKTHPHEPNCGLECGSLVCQQGPDRKLSQCLLKAACFLRGSCNMGPFALFGDWQCMAHQFTRKSECS
jgi:hypothetical protein